MGMLVFFLFAFVALVIISSVFKVAFALLLPVILWMLAGMFAGRIMRGRGYGPIADILLGLVGGIVGNWLFSLVGISLGGGIIGGLIVGVVGAVVVVYIGRLINGGNRQIA